MEAAHVCHEEVLVAQEVDIQQYCEEVLVAQEVATQQYRRKEVLAEEPVEELDDALFECIRTEFALCAAPLDAILAEIACDEEANTTKLAEIACDSPYRPTSYVDAVLFKVAHDDSQPGGGTQQSPDLPSTTDNSQQKKVRPRPRPRRRTGCRNIPRAPNPYVGVPPTHPKLLQGELPTTTATSPCCSVVSSPTPTLSTPHPHYLHPFTIAIIDSGGVALHHHIFGQPLPPPPKMSRFNIPRLRLYTGLRHEPRAANVHQLTHLTCGTRHQPRAPNQFTGSLGTVWFGGLLLCLADDCFSATLFSQ